METQFTGDDFRAEIAFANKERRNENSGGGYLRQHLLDVGFLLPERRTYLTEYPAAAQLRDVLQHRRGRLIVQGCSVPKHHQRGIGKIDVIHPGS